MCIVFYCGACIACTAIPSESGDTGNQIQNRVQNDNTFEKEGTETENRVQNENVFGIEGTETENRVQNKNVFGIEGAETENRVQGENAFETEGTENSNTETAQDGTGKEEKSMEPGEITITKGYKGVEDTNPVMTQRFGADPYAMVYGDRVYLYMTADAFEYDSEGNVTENTYGKIHQINVLSTDDMVNFTDHGSINAASRTGAAQWANNSWAPAAAWKEIDGKDQFFLYFADGGGGIGVLQADSPTGPFRDPLGKGLITRDMPNCGNVLWLFDPAVLVDDDGRSYLYFGGGVPEGKVAAPGTGRVVELGADMISIVGEPQVIDVPYLFEDSGIHKAGGKYYYTYCTNWQVDEAGTEQYGFHSGEIACLVSDAPMGPFVYQETILRNPGSVFGLSGNNHHCVFCFQDQWYITYHTRVLEKEMGVEKGYRCTHIDAFEMQEDGTIGEIRQTLRGRKQVRYVDAYQENPAVSFAVMAGVDTVAEDRNDQSGGGCEMVLTDIDSGDFIKVAGVDFAQRSPKLFAMALRCAENGTARGAVQVRIDSLEGELLACLDITDLTDEQKFAMRETQLLTPVQGVHDLYLIFDGTGFEVRSWKFVGE